MPVIGHHAIAKEAHRHSLLGFVEQSNESVEVTFSLEQRLARYGPIEHVEHIPGAREATTAGHRGLRWNARGSGVDCGCDYPCGETSPQSTPDLFMGHREKLSWLAARVKIIV